MAQYGLDQVRFFFLREVPFGADGSYNHEAIVGRMNSDLANNFGNLAQRSLSMVAKNCEGRVPVPGAFTAEDTAILAQANALLDQARAAFEKQEFSRALEAIWGVLGDTNAYFAEQAPWVLRKTDVERMQTVLYVTLEVLRIVAILAQPVMPTAPWPRCWARWASRRARPGSSPRSRRRSLPGTEPARARPGLPEVRGTRRSLSLILSRRRSPPADPRAPGYDRARGLFRCTHTRARPYPSGDEVQTGAHSGRHQVEGLRIRRSDYSGLPQNRILP